MKIIIIGASFNVGYKIFTDALSKNIPVIGTYYKNKKPKLIYFDIFKDKLRQKLNIEEDDIVIIVSGISNESLFKKKKKYSQSFNLKLFNLVKDLKKLNTNIFFISSESVFDGINNSVFDKSKVCSSTLYGKSKIKIEKILSSYKKSCILRLSNIVPFDKSSLNCVIKKTYISLQQKKCYMAYDNFISLISNKDISKLIYKIIKKRWYLKYKFLNITNSKNLIARSLLAKKIKKASKLNEKMHFEICAFEDIKNKINKGNFKFLSKN